MWEQSRWILGLMVMGVLFWMGTPQSVRAVGTTDSVRYQADQPIIDADLDGLTDEGEKQTYQTDPNNPDTDGDGFLDGTEVLNGKNPTDALSPLGEIARQGVVPDAETPWPWYVGRASGLVGFTLLFLSMFLGLAIRLPGLRRLISPVTSLSVHHWLSLQALAFMMVHGAAFTFDRYLGFSWADVLIPFHSSFQSLLLSFGIVALYVMVLLVVTSLWKRSIPYRVWRAVHFLNITAYVLGVAHALYLGTDLKIVLLRNVFIGLNGLLVVLIVWNLGLKLWGELRNRAAASEEAL